MASQMLVGFSSDASAPNGRRSCSMSFAKSGRSRIDDVVVVSHSPTTKDDEKKTISGMACPSTTR